MIRMVVRHFPVILIIVALTLLPLVAAPHVSNSLSLHCGVSDTIAFCGEVQVLDLFDQTFLISEGGKASETVPFSRWTDFFRISTDSRGCKRLQAIDPTDVRVGDRLCILLDPSGATAQLIEVLPSDAPALSCHADRSLPKE